MFVYFHDSRADSSFHIPSSFFKENIRAPNLWDPHLPKQNGLLLAPNPSGEKTTDKRKLKETLMFEWTFGQHKHSKLSMSPPPGIFIHLLPQGSEAGHKRLIGVFWHFGSVYVGRFPCFSWSYQTKSKIRPYKKCCFLGTSGSAVPELSPSLSS